MKMCVIGLGYVGYPLAMLAWSKSLDVVGVDTNESLRQAISRGDHHRNDAFINGLGAKRALPTTAAVPPSDAFIVCVPTPVTEGGQPDLSFVADSVRSIAAVLQDGNLVVIESTIYPGVCREVAKPLLDAT